MNRRATMDSFAPRCRAVAQAALTTALAAGGGQPPADAQVLAVPSPPPDTIIQAVTDSGENAAALPDHFVFAWNGLERIVYVYQPADLPAGAPCIFVLHGGGINGPATIANEWEYRWNELAELEKFLVVYPQGRPDPPLNSKRICHWNDCRGDIEYPPTNSQEDDVGFIHSLIQFAETQYAIDPNQVFVTGGSNGGMMTLRLAIESPEAFQAAAAIIARRPAVNECPPATTPIPLLLMYGTDDPIYGDDGCVGNCADQTGTVLTMEETIAYWANVNQATNLLMEFAFPDINTNDDSTVTAMLYGGEHAGAPLVVYRVDGGGHTFPTLDANILREPFLGTQNRDIRAADQVWNFFKSN